MDLIKKILEEYSMNALPQIGKTDIIEIIIIAFVIYHIILWIKNTRAWILVKGLVVLLIFCFIAMIFHFNVILWIFKNSIRVSITAILVIFQPELRRALEQLGRKNIVRSIIPFEEARDKNEKFSDKTVSEIIRATLELAKEKTGALMVIEVDQTLTEFERTGIKIDSVISSQLLINIFEHNTPLHDGAVILREDRIVAATCYLPLSDNRRLSKALGTRHRAGVGISEVTDSITIIVSEETGGISIAENGVLTMRVGEEQLRKKLMGLQNKTVEAKKTRLWRGRWKNERKDC